MKAGVFTGIAAAVLAISAIGASAAEDVNIIVDGNAVEFYEQPFIKDGCTMVPYNTIAAPLRVDIVWDKVGQSASVKHIGYDTNVCTMDRATGYAHLSDGSRMELEAPPETFGGRAFIPLRALCEILGYDIDWNGETRTVEIKTREYYEKEFDLKNDTRYSILDNCLTIMLDESSMEQPDYFGYDMIISRSGRNDTELLAYPLYRLSVGNITTDAQNLGYVPCGDSFITDGDIVVLPVEPSEYEKSEDGMDLKYLIKAADDHLFVLSADVHADSEHNRELVLKWLVAAVRSLSNGDGKLDTSARTYDLNGLKISVPDGYTVTHTYDPEGEAWLIIRPETSDKRGDTIARIGVGYHGCADGEVTKYPNGSFLGLPVNWFEYGDADIATDLSCVADTEFYIHIYAPDDKTKKELVAICESIEGDPYALSEKYVKKEK